MLDNYIYISKYSYVYTCAIYIHCSGAKAFARLCIAMNPAVRKFFTPTFYFTRRIINWRCSRKGGRGGGNTRNHGHVVIHRWPSPTHRCEVERVLQLHSRWPLAHPPRCQPYTALPSTPRSAALSSKIEEN